MLFLDKSEWLRGNLAVLTFGKLVFVHCFDEFRALSCFKAKLVFNANINRAIQSVYLDASLNLAMS